MAGSTFLDLVTHEIGVPYVYGGDSPSGGFDCSGLVQWAAGKLGVTLPRGATDQMHAMPHVTDPKAGDLVFFNTGDGWEAGHVGICADSGCSEMIDAPHTGALVRRESVAGFGQIVAYGRLPGDRGQLNVDDQPGAVPDPGDLLGAAGDVIDTVTDPVGAALSVVGQLPGKLLEVLLGGHTVPELALRFTELLGGALVFAAGGVALLVVIAEGNGSPARAARGAKRSTTRALGPARGGVRRINEATTPPRAPRSRTSADRRRLDGLLQGGGDRG